MAGILSDEFFLLSLFDFYLTSEEYYHVCLVCRYFQVKAKSSLLVWRAKIRYGFPQGMHTYREINAIKIQSHEEQETEAKKQLEIMYYQMRDEWSLRKMLILYKGHLCNCIQVDPDKFTLGGVHEPVIQQVHPFEHIVYVPTVQVKHQIMDKLQRYEASNFFSAQEIILYYFVAKNRDKSTQIGDDLWQRMCIVTHKWGVTSLLHDIELVEMGQVNKFSNKIQILNKLVDNQGNLVRTVMDLCL